MCITADWNNVSVVMLYANPEVPVVTYMSLLISLRIEILHGNALCVLLRIVYWSDDESGGVILVGSSPSQSYYF